ncbi:hypothetical protein D3C86_1435680 [compost metagenome]
MARSFLSSGRSDTKSHKTIAPSSIDKGASLKIQIQSSCIAPRMTRGKINASTEENPENPTYTP